MTHGAKAVDKHKLIWLLTEKKKVGRADLGSNLDSFTGEAVALGQGVLYQLIFKSCLHTSSNHGIPCYKRLQKLPHGCHNSINYLQCNNVTILAGRMMAYGESRNVNEHIVDQKGGEHTS